MQSLFIDDKIENVEAAISLGFKGVFIDRKHEDLYKVLRFLETA